MKSTLSLLLPIFLLISSALAHPSPSWLLTLRHLHNRQANTASVGGSTYTVVSSDTLSAIASSASVSLAATTSTGTSACGGGHHNGTAADAAAGGAHNGTAHHAHNGTAHHAHNGTEHHAHNGTAGTSAATLFDANGNAVATGSCTPHHAHHNATDGAGGSGQTAAATFFIPATATASALASAITANVVRRGGVLLV
jgi:hypothetical protein